MVSVRSLKYRFTIVSPLLAIFNFVIAGGIEASDLKRLKNGSGREPFSDQWLMTMFRLD